MKEGKSDDYDRNSQKCTLCITAVKCGHRTCMSMTDERREVAFLLFCYNFIFEFFFVVLSNGTVINSRIGAIIFDQTTYPSAHISMRNKMR